MLRANSLILFGCLLCSHLLQSLIMIIHGETQLERNLFGTAKTRQENIHSIFKLASTTYKKVFEELKNVFELSKKVFELLQNIMELIQNIFELSKKVFKLFKNIVELFQNIVEFLKNIHLFPT